MNLARQDEQKVSRMTSTSATYNTLRGLMLIATFPFILVVGVIYLLGLTARLAWDKPKPRPNNTPCGDLCAHAAYHEGTASYRCIINRGLKCRYSRKDFVTDSDPNNCTMFEKKHY